MSPRNPRCLLALCAAGLLGGTAAVASPPPWAGQPDHPAKPGKGPKTKPESETTAPAPPVTVTTDAPTTGVQSLEEAPDAPPAEAPAPVPAADAPAAPAVKPGKAKGVAKAKGRGKPAVFLVRGRVAAADGDRLVVEVTGGNRRARVLRGLTLTLVPTVVIVDDEVATAGDVEIGDRVVFQLRLPRGITAAEAESADHAPRRLIDITEHAELPPAEEAPPVEEAEPVL